jgi:hypothetical protein
LVFLSNPDIRFSCLALGGAHRVGADGRSRFVAAVAPTPAQLQVLLAAMIAFIDVLHTIGLSAAQGLTFAESTYWDLNDRTTLR